MGINIREKEVKEMGMCELCYNNCYVKDKQAMYRDYDTDVSARDLIRNIYKNRNVAVTYDFWADDNYFDEFMLDNLQYGFKTFDGVMAMLYQMIWSKAEMREVIINASKGEDINTMI